MPRNKLTDLNNHLFEQLERLNDEELSEEELDNEIKRARSMNTIARTIINNARLSLDAKKHIDEYGLNRADLPELLLDHKEK